jgi:hypothetical protein
MSPAPAAAVKNIRSAAGSNCRYANKFGGDINAERAAGTADDLPGKIYRNGGFSLNTKKIRNSCAGRSKKRQIRRFGEIAAGPRNI